MWNAVTAISRILLVRRAKVSQRTVLIPRLWRVGEEVRAGWTVELWYEGLVLVFMGIGVVNMILSSTCSQYDACSQSHT